MDPVRFFLAASPHLCRGATIAHVVPNLCSVCVSGKDKGFEEGETSSMRPGQSFARANPSLNKDFFTGVMEVTKRQWNNKCFHPNDIYSRDVSIYFSRTMKRLKMFIKEGMKNR